MKSANKKLCEKTESLEQEKDQLEQQLKDQEEELQHQEKKLAKLQDEVSDLKEIQEEYQQKWKILNAKAEKLRESKQTREAETENIRRKTRKHISTLETVIDRYEEKISVLEIQREATTQEVSGLNQQIATLENTCREKSAALARERKTALDLFTMYEKERTERVTVMYKVMLGCYIFIFIASVLVLLFSVQNSS